MAQNNVFKDVVSETALTTPIARKYFEGRISAPVYRGDVVMETVCNALFDKRLHEGERIQVVQRNQYYTGGTFDVGDFLREFRDAADGSLYICSVSVAQKDKGGWKSTVDTSLAEMGFFQMKDIEMAMDKASITSVCWTNTQPDAKTRTSPFDNTKTIILMENINLTRWHLLCMLLKRFLGKWFSETPMTPEEQAGFQTSFLKENATQLLEAAQQYADTLDFRGQFIRSSLGDIETRFAKQKAKQLEDECSRIDRQIDDASRKIGSLIAQREEAEAAMWGFQQKGKEVEPATMNMFLGNKNLVLKDASNDYIEFFVSGWLEAFDPEKAKSCFKPGRMEAWLEYNRSFDIPNEDAEMLYKAIFLDETCKILLWSHYTLYFRNDSPVVTHGGSTCPSEIQHALPNPHHQYNSCFGNNRQLVNEAMRRYNVVGAIAQCQSATMGINLTEHASFKFFSKDLFDPRYGEVIWVCELNQWMTTKDAIAYLKKKEESAA